MNQLFPLRRLVAIGILLGMILGLARPGTGANAASPPASVEASVVPEGSKMSRVSSARVYSDPLYKYELQVPAEWRISPTPAGAVYGASVLHNYDPDLAETTGILPSDALKVQIGIVPLPPNQDFQDWVAKWIHHELRNEAALGLLLELAGAPSSFKLGPFTGVRYTIHGPAQSPVLVLNLESGSGQVIVVGLSPADSPTIPTALQMLAELRISDSFAFSAEALRLAEKSAARPTPEIPQSILMPSAPLGTCPVGTFPGDEAPNSPITLYMPFRAGETWTVGGAGAFYGNWYHCNSNDDYYATDWNRAGDDGAAVLPVADGTISAADPPSCPTTGYGCYVQIDHASNIRTMYGHLSSVTRTSGWVSHSDQIGTVGTTGNSTGPHLHLSFRRNESGGYHSRCYNNGNTCPNGESPLLPQGPKPSPMNTTSGARNIVDGQSYTSSNSGGSSNCDGSDGAYLYEHSNYTGRCSKFTGDSPNPTDWYVGNDAASSIRFVGNYQATVYEHDNYNGTSSAFTADDPDFGNDAIAHDRASSLRVGPRSIGPTSCPDGQFLAEYFNNRYLAGSPTFRQCESSINRDWGYNGPGNGVGSDNFSVRWTGRFWFNAGNYRFTTRTDDGVRLRIDDVSLVDQWRDMGATTFNAERTLTAALHTVRMEYYENGGYATAGLGWALMQAPTDPDDDRTVSFGQSLDGTISPAGDRDAYYFDGSAGEVVSVRMEKRDSNLDSYIELYNPDGTLLGQDDDRGGNLNSWLSITLRQNGRHKIIARGYSTSTGGYRLSLARESTADADDNRWIAFGGTLQGTISPINDRDWYYFSAVAGRAISLRMNKIDSGLDSYLELYNPSGVKVAENDDGGGDRNAWIVYTVPSSGVYRILARSWSLASSGRYVLSLGAVSNTNLALGKWAWATSTEFTGVEPYKAFDGSLSTRWSSRFSDPQLIYVDLGSARTFNQVVLRWESAYARRFGIYYWNGSSWINVYWTDFGDGGVDTITFAPVRAQVVGMYGVQRGTPWGYSLWEFEVYDNTALPLPVVPPDPGDKPPETVDPVTPLPPNEEDKPTLLIGEGLFGQEDMPLAGEGREGPLAAPQAGLPSAFILYPNPSGALAAPEDLVLFQGAASDNDEDGLSIVEYQWNSDLIGAIGATDTFTLPGTTLGHGMHVITFLARDNEGHWSPPVTTTLTIGLRLYLPMITK